MLHVDKVVKKLARSAAVLVAGCAMVAPAVAAPVCLPTRDMTSSDPQNDGKAIVFHMRDGSVWRNDLKGACPDLRFNGFTWVLRDPNYTVCEDTQALRVLQSGQVCVLGKFTQIEPPHAQQHSQR